MADEEIQEPEVTTPDIAPDVSIPVEPTVEVTETPLPPAFSVLEAAKSAGFPVESYETDSDAFAALMQHTRGLEAELYNQPKPEPTPEPPKEEEWNLENHFGGLWSVPKYDPSWEESLTVNAQGQLEPKPNVPWGVAQKAMTEYTDYQSARTSSMKGMFETGNPFQQMYDALKPAFERDFAGRNDINEAFSGKETEDFLQTFVDGHSDWLNTADGQAFDQAATQLQAKGLSWKEAIETASWLHGPKQNGQPNTEAAPAPTTQPNADPPPTQPKQEETSFVDDAIAKAGHSPNGGGAPSTPTSNQGQLGASDVRNMFSRKHAQSSAAT